MIRRMRVLTASGRAADSGRIFRAARVAGSARGGFSLVELIVAIVLLGVVLATLGGLSFRMAQNSLDIAASSSRDALGLALVNHITSIDYDSLPNLPGHDTVQVGNAVYEQEVTMVAGVGRTDVTVVVTPLPLGPDSSVRTFQFTRVQEPLESNPMDFTP
jgi:prepilin-type N-terminal cleavage/methylation domain-containing protein